MATISPSLMNPVFDDGSQSQTFLADLKKRKGLRLFFVSHGKPASFKNVITLTGLGSATGYLASCRAVPALPFPTVIFRCFFQKKQHNSRWAVTNVHINCQKDFEKTSRQVCRT
jgi:hypothetical protein